MALTKTLTMPAAPSASLATVLASAIATMRAATPADVGVAHVGERDRQQNAIDDAAEQVSEKHPDQLAKTAPQLDLPSQRASGTSAKLPVTSSRPSSTIMTRPTGNTISAPTSGWPVVSAPVKASAGGGAEQRAGERAADQQIARAKRQLPSVLASIIEATTSAGFA